jgi:hypothetical protein
MTVARRFTRCIVQRQFRKVADALRQPVVYSIFDNLYGLFPTIPNRKAAQAGGLCEGLTKGRAKKTAATSRPAAFTRQSAAGLTRSPEPCWFPDMSPRKNPPAFVAWSQHREHCRFREWCKSGHVWFEKNDKGEVTGGCLFQAMYPRAGDGFTWFFPSAPSRRRKEAPQRPRSGDEQ